MALNEQQRKVIVDNFDELFANPRALGNELAMNDNYTYGEIVKEGLQEERAQSLSKGRARGKAYRFSSRCA